MTVARVAVDVDANSDCADAAADDDNDAGGIERQTRRASRPSGISRLAYGRRVAVSDIRRAHPPRGGIISPRYSPCTPSSERGKVRMYVGATNRSTRHESIDVHWVDHGGERGVQGIDEERGREMESNDVSWGIRGRFGRAPNEEGVLLRYVPFRVVPSIVGAGTRHDAVGSSGAQHFALRDVPRGSSSRRKRRRQQRRGGRDAFPSFGSTTGCCRRRPSPPPPSRIVRTSSSRRPRMGDIVDARRVVVHANSTGGRRASR